MEDTLPERIEERAKHFQDNFARLKTEIGKVFVGHPDIVEAVLTCLFGDGHTLLEGVPGLGKTLLRYGWVEIPASFCSFTPHADFEVVIGYEADTKLGALFAPRSASLEYNNGLSRKTRLGVLFLVFVADRWLRLQLAL